MKKMIALVGWGLFLPFAALSQDMHFSMFYNAPLQLNPALTGTHECFLRVGTNFKDQWRSVSSAYRTYNLFADARISSEKLKSNSFGAGLQFLGDNSGTGNLATNDVKLALAYHKDLLDKNRLVFSMGLSMDLVNHSLSPEKLTFESQWTGNTFDPSLAQNENFAQTSLSYFDMNAGIALNYAPSSTFNANIGGSLGHLTKPEYSYLGGTNPHGIKTCIHGGVNVMLNDNTALSPRVCYTLQDKASEFLAGCNLRLAPGTTPCFLGLWYRWGRDLIPLAGIEIANFQLMMAYDFNVSRYKIATKSLGGFEISLVKNLLCGTQSFASKSNKKKKITNCPKF